MALRIAALEWPYNTPVSIMIEGAAALVAA
jgi:hypothetical protein